MSVKKIFTEMYVNQQKVLNRKWKEGNKLGNWWKLVRSVKAKGRREKGRKTRPVFISKKGNSYTENAVVPGKA
jgi:hypothetical protein